MDWASTEMATLALGDKRLNNRAIKLLNTFGVQPSLSIPAACQGWHETKAAYRFFDHANVTSEQLYAPHREASLVRMKEHKVVLFVQDTTILNFTGQNQREDIGPINKDNNLGLLLHTSLAITPERLCLGIMQHKQWCREELANLTHRERSVRNQKRPLEEKETYRWLEGYRIANQYAHELPDTKIISVADREGDIYDIYKEAQMTAAEGGAYWLIRASHDRRVIDKDGQKQGDKLIASTKKEGLIGEVEFEMPSHKNRSARKVKQAIYVGEIILDLPDKRRKGSDYKRVKTNVVIASEINPPKGEKALEWTLLTNLTVTNLEEAVEVIRYYMCRWQIEIFFKVLKSGCKVEKLQISNEARFSPCLTLYMIIAWRILYVTMLGRECPEMSCESIFDKVEWQTLYIVFKKKKPPPKPPRLDAVIEMIAQLGGYLNRKGDGAPGATVMWTGLRSMHEHVRAREAFELVYGQTYG
jgi:hypothetical protein